MSASIGEISLLHSLSTLAFSPSGPEALWTLTVQQFGDPFWVNCYVPHGGERTSPFRGRVRVVFTCEGWLELPITNVAFFLRICLNNSVFSEWCDPICVFFKWFDKWPKLCNLFRLGSVGIWAIVRERKYIGNVFPIGISQYLLNMCSEPLVMIFNNEISIGKSMCCCILVWGRY